MGFVIDTKKPIHRPISVTIDGREFKAKDIARDEIKDIERFAREAVKGDPEAAYKQMEVIFGKHKELDKLDIRIVDDLLQYVTLEIFKGEKADTPEKKDKRPGDKSSPS